MTTASLGGVVLVVVAGLPRAATRRLMAVAVSIHYIPKRITIATSLRAMGVSEWRMVWGRCS